MSSVRQTSETSESEVGETRAVHDLHLGGLRKYIACMIGFMPSTAYSIASTQRGDWRDATPADDGNRRKRIRAAIAHPIADLPVEQRGPERLVPLFRRGRIATSPQSRWTPARGRESKPARGLGGAAPPSSKELDAGSRKACACRARPFARQRLLRARLSRGMPVARRGRGMARSARRMRSTSRPNGDCCMRVRPTCIYQRVVAKNRIGNVGVASSFSRLSCTPEEVTFAPKSTRPGRLPRCPRRRTSSCSISCSRSLLVRIS